MVGFGVVLPQYGVGYDLLLKVAKESERIGFDSIWLEDHFIPWSLPADHPTLECWTILSALAAQTEKIRVGTLCSCASYRHPSLLAKMAATVDRISKGRLELGIGAGWYGEEYNAYGLTFPSPAERVARLKETVQLIRAMWTRDRATYHGRFYSVNQAVCRPEPVQKPHPPIWVGGGGEKRMLRVIAEVADGWNWGAMTPQEFERKSQLLDGHAKRLRRGLPPVRKSLEAFVFIAENESQIGAKIDAARKLKASKKFLVDAYVDTSIRGTPRQIVSQVQAYVDAGADHMMLVFPDAAELSPLELFAEQVLPLLRSC